MEESKTQDTREMDPPTELLTATVPEGMITGQIMRVKTESGLVECTIPPGLSPGDKFLVQVEVLARATELKDGVGWLAGLKRDVHLGVIVTSAATYVILALLLACNLGGQCVASILYIASPLFAVLPGVLAFVFVVEMLASRTFRLLLSIEDAQSGAQLVSRLRAAPPVITWRIECYHNETRTRTKTGSNGKTETETYTERVVTHRASKRVELTSWQDTTLPYGSLTEYKMTKMVLDKRFEADAQYYAEQAAWIRANNHDVHQDFYESLAIDGFKSLVLCIAEPEKKPFLANALVCVAAQLTVVLALPYRCALPQASHAPSCPPRGQEMTHAPAPNACAARHPFTRPRPPLPMHVSNIHETSAPLPVLTLV
jgi:hypothetical protein